jgi:hypothetical protein
MASAASAVLAGLRSASRAERVAAAERAAALTDLNLVPDEVQRTGGAAALRTHAAAEALARGGACVSLAAKLRPAASVAEQQAACRVLRCVFAALEVCGGQGAAPWMRANVTMPGARAHRAPFCLGACCAHTDTRLAHLHTPPDTHAHGAARHGAAAAALYEGGGAERLCALVGPASPGLTAAGNAACALRVVFVAAGWCPRLEAALNTDATLSSLLALAGGAVQPDKNSNAAISALELYKAVLTHCGRGARRFCSPSVLSGGAVPILVAVFATASAHQPTAEQDEHSSWMLSCGREQSSCHARAGEVLQLIVARGADEDGGRDALARCQRTLAVVAFDVLLQPRCAAVNQSTRRTSSTTGSATSRSASHCVTANKPARAALQSERASSRPSTS